MKFWKGFHVQGHGENTYKMQWGHKTSSDQFCLGCEGRHQGTEDTSYLPIVSASSPGKLIILKVVIGTGQIKCSIPFLLKQGENSCDIWGQNGPLTYLLRNIKCSHVHRRDGSACTYCVTTRNAATHGDLLMQGIRFEVCSKDPAEDTQPVCQFRTENHLPQASSSHRLLTLSQFLIPRETRTWFIPSVALLFMCSMIKRIIIQKEILQRQKNYVWSALHKDLSVLVETSDLFCWLAASGYKQGTESPH